MTGGDAGGLHRTLQRIPPRLLSTPWILAGAIRSIPGIGGCPPGRLGIRGAKPCSLAIRDVVAVPCSNGILPYDTTINVCTELPDPVSLVLSAGASVHGRRYPAVTRAGDPRSVRESMAVPENRGVTGALRVPVPQRFRNTSTVNPTGYDPHDTREMRGIPLDPHSFHSR